MRRFLVSISFIAAFLISHAVHAEGMSSSAPLRFATDPSYPPFEYHNSQGQLDGFDIALAQALCDRLMRRCEFVEQPFNSILSGLRLGAYDAAIAALDINDSRLALMRFTQPYLANAAVLLVNRNAITDNSVNKDNVVGVQTGTSLMKFVVNGRLGADIIPMPYASYQQAFSDLQTGKINAVFTDQAVALHWLSQHPDGPWAILGEPYTASAYFGQGMGIALPAQSYELRAALNQAIDALRADGTLQALKKKYLYY